MGLLPLTSGETVFDGRPVAGRPFDVARAGIAHVPETRDTLPSLTVCENLEIAARRFGGAAPGWTMARVLGLFQRRGERLDNGGTRRSGGEQQTLAIGRALLMNRRLLILDEPTGGVSMIVVERNFGYATSLADDVVVVGKGQVVWTGSAEAIRADRQTQRTWLDV